MAGQGFNAQPPPRPASHNAFGGGHQNPGNQLYVGNVYIPFRISSFRGVLVLSFFSVAIPSWLAGPEGFVPPGWQYH